VFVAWRYSQQSLHDADHKNDEVQKSRCNSVSYCHRPTTLRASISFRSARETPPTDGEKPTRVSATNDSPDSVSVVSPLRVFARRRDVARPALVAHGSFKSYFRPAAPSSRRRHTVVARQSAPDQRRTPSRSHSDASPPSRGRIYRKLATGAPPPPARPSTVSSPPVMRRRSVFGRVGGGGTAAGALPAVQLGRRYTVVGGDDTVDGAQPPPTPLSLRDIYKLSRHGSVRGRMHCSVHRRRTSAFSLLRFEKDCSTCASSKASVGIARCESDCRRRRRLASCSTTAQSPTSERRTSLDNGLRDDDDAAAADLLRRRRSYIDSIEQKHEFLASDPLSGSGELPQPLPGGGNHDNAVCDTNKTTTFDIMLVSVYW